MSYAVSVAAPEMPRYTEQLRPQVAALQNRLQTLCVSLPAGSTGGGGGGGSSEGLTQLAGGVLSGLGSFASALGLAVLTLTVLAFLLVEARGYRTKFERGVLQNGGDKRVSAAVSRMTGKFARCFLVKSFSSLVTGLLTGLFCWLVGLECAFVWGLLAAVFNFVPTGGSIVAVVPPTLFASVFGGLGTALLVLVGLGLIEFVTRQRGRCGAAGERAAVL